MTGRRREGLKIVRPNSPGRSTGVVAGRNILFLLLLFFFALFPRIPLRPRVFSPSPGEGNFWEDTMGADLDTPSRNAQLLFASRKCEGSTGAMGCNDRATLRGEFLSQRCGNKLSGFPGVPLIRISKYSCGEPCGPLPIVAMRCPAVTASPSWINTEFRCP